MSHFNRPVNTELDLVVAYPSTGEAVIHAKGCAHTKGNRSIRNAWDFTYNPEDAFEDWFFVAPCAAAGKGKICTRFGADCDC